MRSLLASGVLTVLLVLLLTSDLLNLPLFIGVLLILALIILSGWLDSRLEWSIAGT